MKSGIERIGHDVSVEAAVRGCFGKVRYPTKNVARDCATKLRKKHPESPLQRPYTCSLCNGVHLTSKVPAGLQNRERKRA